MAVTFAITNARKNVVGNLRCTTGTITATGTTTDNGDALTAAQVGLHTIQSLNIHPFVDSTSNPENGSDAMWIPTSNGLGGALTGVVVFLGGAASGTVQAAVSDGATVTGYSAQFEAYGT